MTLLDFFQILSRRKWVIILTAFFTLDVFALAVFNTPPKYTATSSVRILTTRSGSADYVEYNVDYSTRVMNTYKELATSAPVLEELGRYVSPVPSLEVNIIPDSELIEISATDIDPALAQFAANKLGDIIVDQSKLMVSTDEPPVNAYVAESAALPDKPSSPSPYLLTALGLAVGLIGGLALAFVFESLDTRLYTLNQIETETDLLTIGNIPDFNGINGHQKLHIFEKQVGAESFRRLTANILSIMRDKGIKSFLVASPVPRDGRSTIVANLAITLAQTNRKVLVIDADMRNPKMHEIFGMPNTHGLTRLLTLKQDASKSIQATGFEGVSLLTSGPRPANPIEILGTTEMHGLINYLEKHYDVILLDTPPCLSVTDAVVAASKVGGVVLVVRVAWVRREVLQNTLNQLRNANVNIVGVVVNRTKLGARARRKAAILLEKNGSAPRGQERDLREPSLPERQYKEPKIKDKKETRAVPDSVDRQPQQAQPQIEPAEVDLRIPRPPRQTIMPEYIASAELEHTRKSVRRKDASDRVMKSREKIQHDVVESVRRQPVVRDRLQTEHKFRERDMHDFDVHKHDIQESVAREPDIRERVVRQPAIRERELSSHRFKEVDLHQRVVREPEPQPPHVRHERDLDYERYIRNRDIHSRVPRQRLQRQQEQEWLEHDQYPSDDLDDDLRDRDARYSHLDELDINGIDDFPSLPRGPQST